MTVSSAPLLPRPPAIHTEQLSRRYGEIDALRPLDLQVERGSVFGFLGRNGAGKTTTMRLITGLARPTTGRAWVDGVETTNADSLARSKFGYLPQDPAFYNWMTPVAYLDYVGRLFDMDAAARKRRIGEVLALVDLEAAAQRRIGGFSGGMAQRLGIAQALLHQPPVLFLDEPTSSLDPAGRHEVLALIEQLHGEVTIFFSSHILADVERVCDTIGMIHHGELLLVAEREALLARYATNVIALTLDEGSLPQKGALMTTLLELPWVAGIDGDDEAQTAVYISVRDVAAAKAALLPVLVAQRVELERYEWKRPSLEDVFLQLSGETENG